MEQVQISQQNFLNQIRFPVLKDLSATETLICKELVSSVPLIQEITHHIVQSGGKRLRPLLVLLSSYACGYQDQDNEHHELAAVIEFLHTATLLHDDVIDASTLRRGHKTANALWGNSASVLVGDFLYSRAFQILASRNNVAIMKCLASTTNAIAEGEVQQLMNQHNPDLAVSEYYQVIHHKTAKLFESAAEIGAILAGRTDLRNALALYGVNLGMAFQIMDDLLDYCSDSKTLGKNVGDDLAEGKVTLPLIIAMQCCQLQAKEQIRSAILDGNLAMIPFILEVIKTTETVEIIQQKATFFANKAYDTLVELPQSPYRQSLFDLVKFSMRRSY